MQSASKQKLKSCRQAMAYTLNMHSVSCPEKCITFGSFGRFNNFIKSLVAAIERNVFVNNETNRKSVHIDASLWQQFNLDNVWDSSALNQIYVFRQQLRSSKCERVSVKTLFYATCLDKQKCLLIKAWLLFGAVQENIHNQVLKLIERVGHDYSTLHSRFLEDSCHVRHKKIHLSTDYCDMKPEFVKKTLAAMGHFNQPFFICSDRQQMQKVKIILQEMNGTLSPLKSVIHDIILMINSKRFMGNPVSSLSDNIHGVRDIFDSKINSTTRVFDITTQKSNKGPQAYSLIGPKSKSEPQTVTKLRNICVTRSETGNIMILLSASDAKICYQGKLQVCPPSFTWGDHRSNVNLCVSIECQIFNEFEKQNEIHNRLALSSMRFAHHFGWHAILDNFIAYWESWYGDKDGEISENSLKTRDILFLNDSVYQNQDDVAIFLHSAILGKNGSIINLEHFKKTCYRECTVGARKIKIQHGYNKLLQKRPWLFKSFSHMMRVRWKISENVSMGRIFFLNREQNYGHRRVDGFNQISDTLQFRLKSDKNIHVAYADGLSSLDLVSQLRLVAQNVRILISTHGSQLTWIMFMNKDSVVVEIFGTDPRYRHKTDYKDIATSCSLKYVRWQGLHGDISNIVIPDHNKMVNTIVKLYSTLINVSDSIEDNAEQGVKTKQAQFRNTIRKQ